VGTAGTSANTGTPGLSSRSPLAYSVATAIVASPPISTNVGRVEANAQRFKDKSYVWFAKRWKRILTGARPGGIEAMHLKDLVAGKREFHGLPVAQLQRVLGECVALLMEAATGVAGAIVDQTEFEEVAGPGWPRRFGSIYTFLFFA
jgi:hypothetical protein